MHERRRDPRTDPLYSLRNLLQVSAEKFRMDLLVLGSPDDLLIAGSEEDRAAYRALLDEDDLRSRHTFLVGHQRLTLVTPGEPTGSQGAHPGLLESVLLCAISQAVKRILRESPQPVPAALPPRGW